MSAAGRGGEAPRQAPGEAMEDLDKSKKMLVEELATLRRQLAALQAERRLNPAVTYVCRIEGEHFLPVSVSENFGDQFGYEQHDFLGDAAWWGAHLHPEDRERVFGELAGLFKHDHHVHEYRMRHGDGTYVWVRDELNLARDEQGVPNRIVGSWLDITERRRMEDELIRLERTRARSQILQGINHNLKNLFHGISAPIEILKSRLEDSDSRIWLDMLGNASHRASELFFRLDRIVQIKGEEPQPVEIAPIVREAVHTTRPRWQGESEASGAPHIDVVTELDAVPPVHATPSELHDMLVNLVFNAVDAMPQGGALTIATRLSGGKVTLSVKDTGTGMDEATQRRIFEPFFTTKSDVGRGLGLYTVQESLNNWDADVAVESRPGHGTTFTLQLAPWEGREPSASPAERRAKILVSDHDEATTNPLVLYLSHEFEVEVIKDGDAAIAGFAPNQYEVALIDAELPGPPVDLVASRLRQRDRAIALVLMTGSKSKAQELQLEAFDFCYQKPLFVEQVDELVTKAVTLHDSRA